MNCNPCCGCFPPTTTYNPSAADNFPTILQQVEYLKALLKKYPSQQWFITQEKVTEETVKLDSTKIPLRGRAIAVGDFILGNTVDGTILIFQYTGATVEVTNYVVEYVGIYTNQDVAEEALAKAQQALGLASSNEQNIAKLEGEMVDKVNRIEMAEKVDKIEIGSDDIVYAVSKNTQTYFYVSGWEIKPLSIVRRNNDGDIRANGFLLPSGAAFKNNSFVTKGGKNISYPEPSDNTYFATAESVNIVVNNLKFKKLFGNTIKGSGNIDLYHHEISYGAINDGITITVNFEHYSSKYLKADSLTDVKSLLGNTFKKGIFGSITNTATGKALVPLYINETNIFYIGEDGSVKSQTLSGTFTDIVTTI